MEKIGADIIVESLKNHKVPYVFGIPGAKIDGVFNALVDGGPELIVTRHEQNAAFMAQAVGRLTGEPGVVLTTSGPGSSNLATGLVTATAEGDPVLAIGGQVKRGDLLKLTHQSMDNAALFEPITKYSAEVQDPATLSETIANAYRLAKSAKKGASFISVPQDVVDSPTSSQAIKPLPTPHYGQASPTDIAKIAKSIKQAKLPVLLVGMRASEQASTFAIRNLLTKVKLPVVETFQAAGLISRELENLFFGRVGLFRNQPGDMLLKRSDLVITIGYDPIEYEARNWNAEKNAKVINIDGLPAEIDQYLQPELEIIGDIAKTIDALAEYLTDYQLSEDSREYLNNLQVKLQAKDIAPTKHLPNRLHPLGIIHTLQENINDNMIVTVDVGSHYIWMARHFRSYEPRHLLFSNGMQTLGVALPWAIAAGLLYPDRPIVSVSGDGGFLFSAQDLETAVRKKLNIVHLIWNDGQYNMVEFQEKMKYGRASGVNFGPVDFVKYAEAFGAKGIRVTNTDQLKTALLTGFATEGPVIIDIPVDYQDNQQLGKTILPDQFY